MYIANGIQTEFSSFFPQNCILPTWSCSTLRHAKKLPEALIPNNPRGGSQTPLRLQWADLDTSKNWCFSFDNIFDTGVAVLGCLQSATRALQAGRILSFGSLRSSPPETTWTTVNLTESNAKMFQLPIPSLKSFNFFSRDKQVFEIPLVKVYDLENSQDKSARALKHLLKLNHANYAILYNARKFHNHAPHVSEALTEILQRRNLADVFFFSSSPLHSYRGLMRMIWRGYMRVNPSYWKLGKMLLLKLLLMIGGIIWDVESMLSLVYTVCACKKYTNSNY